MIQEPVEEQSEDERAKALARSTRGNMIPCNQGSGDVRRGISGGNQHDCPIYWAMEVVAAVAKFPIIYPDLRFNYKVATHPLRLHLIRCTVG